MSAICDGSSYLQMPIDESSMQLSINTRFTSINLSMMAATSLNGMWLTLSISPSKPCAMM